MGPAGLGLVLPAPDRPAQAVVDGVLVAVGEVEESADFSEGECDKTAVDGWFGSWFGWVRLFGWRRSPFLVCCAVTAR